MSGQIRDKVAIVTGASSGIGKAIARQLSAMGMRLVLIGRDQARLENLVDELSCEAIWIATDLADEHAVQKLVDQTMEQFGSIDVLVENAGVFGNESVADTAPSDIVEMVNVNLTSVILLAQAVLLHMRKTKSGEILVVGSIAGISDMRNEAVYSATKHGVNAFVRSLRRQVQADGIRVGSVLPGTVATELWGKVDPQKTDQQVDAREVLRPEDIAEIVAFMITRPPNVSVRELVVLPQAQDI